MRKLLALLLLSTVPCYAGIISHTDYQSGTTITASAQNSNENTIVNEFNGNIDDNNIKSGANIAVSKLATLTVNSVVTTDSGGHLTASSGILNGFLTVTSSANINGTLTQNGSIIFSTNTTQGITGTTTDNVASAGLVGEISSRTFSGASAPTSNQWGDPASITLTAGDWELSGQLYVQSNTAAWNTFEVGISTSSGNTAANLNLGDTAMAAQFANTSTAVTQGSLTITSLRMGFTTTTTVYLKTLVIYSGGTPVMFGRITARRMR